MTVNAETVRMRPGILAESGKFKQNDAGCHPAACARDTADGGTTRTVAMSYNGRLFSGEWA